MLHDSFMLGENIPVAEVLAEPCTNEALDARYLLGLVHGGLRQLVDQKMEAAEQISADTGEGVAGESTTEAPSEPSTDSTRRTGFRYPTAEDGSELHLGERVAYLKNNFDKIHVEDFVRAGFTLGAQRMDVRADQEGTAHGPVHESTVKELLASESVKETNRRGFEDVVDPDIATLRGVGTGSLARIVAAELDPKLVNALVAMEAAGYSPRTSNAAPGAIVSQFIYYTLRHQAWPPKLTAITMALGMHHTAMRGARRFVRPFLVNNDADLPRMKEDMKVDFWEKKLAGYHRGEGAFYYIGFLEKSRSTLRQLLQEEWGQDYVRNRQVLTSALLVGTGAAFSGLSHARIKEIRRPIFQLIREGHFDAAQEQLRQTAQSHPHLFSRLARKMLLGDVAFTTLPHETDDLLE